MLVVGSSASVVLCLLHYSESPFIDSNRKDPLSLAMIFHAGLTLIATSSFIACRRRGTIHPTIPRIMLVMSIAVLVGCADVLAGLVFAPTDLQTTAYFYHPVRGWTSRPNVRVDLGGVTVRTNAHGLRIDEHSEPPDRPGVLRILFVGDSLTLGWGVRNRDTFVEVSAETLRTTGKSSRIVALNGGTCGYDTFQECDWLMSEGLALQPDMVVLQFCLNDICEQYDPSHWNQPDRPGAFYNIATPNSWSGIARAVLAQRSLPRTPTGLTRAGEEIERFEILECLTSSDSPKVRAAWTSVLTDLERMENACRSIGAGFVLVCFPVVEQLADTQMSTWPQKELAKWCDSRRRTFIDLYPVYMQHIKTGRSSVDQLMMDRVHPTIRGHAIAGTMISSALETSGLMRRPPSRQNH